MYIHKIYSGLENVRTVTLESIVIIRNMMMRGPGDDHRPLGKTKWSKEEESRRLSSLENESSIHLAFCLPYFLLAYPACMFYPEDPKSGFLRNFTRLREVTYHKIVLFRPQCNWRSIYLRSCFILFGLKTRIPSVI
jgi:hypothetical protein